MGLHKVFFDHAFSASDRYRSFERPFFLVVSTYYRSVKRPLTKYPERFLRDSSKCLMAYAEGVNCNSLLFL